MYQLSDTIVAVSSPSSDNRVIVRITGPGTIGLLQQIFNPSIGQDKAGIVPGSVAVDSQLRLEALLYLFLAPRSYTGETLGEIHLHSNSSVTEALMAGILAKGFRMAGPGEFTARAYLNGKIDLAQAEAVNEIVTCSNKFQLAAAEKLLSGRLAETTAKVCSAIIDCLSLVEAGLDFSGEDIEFISVDELVERLNEITGQLEQLLAGSINYESVIDLPAVGIAGAPNAGKSSLLNKLLGKERSIVSKQRKTTRDVLTGLLTLEHCRCVLFDCAGLISEPSSILDELAQQAAVESLNGASIVVLCVDVSKADWAEDIVIRKLIKPQILIAVANKCDLLAEDALAKRLAVLGELLGADFLAVSAKTGEGLELLREKIDSEMIEAAIAVPTGESQSSLFSAASESTIGLTSRHKQAVTDAIENITQAITEIKSGSDEVAAMMLRAGHQALSDIEQANVDEQILENIFSRFCIGK